MIPIPLAWIGLCAAMDQSAPASSPAAGFSLARERLRVVGRCLGREVTVGEVLDRIERDWWPDLSRDLDGPYGYHHLRSPLFDRWVSDHIDLLLLEKARPADRIEPGEIRRVARERVKEELGRLEKAGRPAGPEIEAALLDRRLRQEGTAIERDLRLDQAIGPLRAEDVRGHFYGSALNYGGKVRAAHLFFSTRDPGTGARLPLAQREASARRAEAARKRLDGGADFAELARTLSEDTDTAEKGGDLGFFPREGRVPDAVARAAFAAHPGEIVGPVESEGGVHVIRILERRVARHPDFNAVRVAVERDLRRERKREHLLELRRDAGVVIY